MKQYQLTEDMAQNRKYWMTKILADHVDVYKEMVKKGEKYDSDFTFTDFLSNTLETYSV